MINRTSVWLQSPPQHAQFYTFSVSCPSSPHSTCPALCNGTLQKSTLSTWNHSPILQHTPIAPIAKCLVNSVRIIRFGIQLSSWLHLSRLSSGKPEIKVFYFQSVPSQRPQVQSEGSVTAMCQAALMQEAGGRYYGEKAQMGTAQGVQSTTLY